MTDETALLSIADWRDALCRGEDLPALLRARVGRLNADRRDAAWITRVTPAELEPQLDRLARWAHEAADLPTLLGRRPLWGVPFVVKDNIHAEGLPTTAGCPAFAHQPSRSASVVHRLLESGAVLLGKSNLDQFATGLVGTRSPYGAPGCVADSTRISGGSSSGSAVLVARGDAAFALGTDTAGSGRIPAAFNGLFGLKPTPGRVSTAGVVPACRSLDCVSIFATSADDAACVLALIEGDDPADDFSRFVAGPASLPARPRIGVPALPVLEAADGYPAAWRAALARLELLGDVVPLDFEPLHAVATLLYGGPWVAERYAVVQDLIENRPEAMDRVVHEVIAGARRFSALDAFRASYALQAHRRRAERLWQQVDLLVVPSAPRHPTLAQVAAEPIAVNSELGRYTNFVNLLGWSALAVPAGRTERSLPFGITAIGPAAADLALLDWVRRWTPRPAVPGGGAAALPALPTPASQPTQALAVVGAHLSGLPLNGQLLERGAALAETTHTAASYRLHALPGTTPPKPGLQRVARGGRAIAVEVWNLPNAQWASFMALVPAPLAIGRIELADGRWVHGFVCEPAALADAPDVSEHGGWRAYLASRIPLHQGEPPHGPS